jgi:hypothetical protein
MSECVCVGGVKVGMHFFSSFFFNSAGAILIIMVWWIDFFFSRSDFKIRYA